MSADEWPIFRELRLEAIREAPYAFGSTLSDWQGERDSEARWRERLESVPFNAIAYLDGAPAGMASGTKPSADGAIELISMWVAPFARGKGVADTLVTAVADWARQQRAAKISLDVATANERAKAFYRRVGFEDQGAVDAPAGGRPEHRMLRIER